MYVEKIFSDIFSICCVVCQINKHMSLYCLSCFKRKRMLTFYRLKLGFPALRSKCHHVQENTKCFPIYPWQITEIFSICVLTVTEIFTLLYSPFSLEDGCLILGVLHWCLRFTVLKLLLSELLDVMSACILPDLTNSLEIFRYIIDVQFFSLYNDFVYGSSSGRYTACERILEFADTIWWRTLRRKTPLGIDLLINFSNPLCT